MIEITMCPNCGSTEKQSIYNVPDRHYGIKGTYTISECTKCGLVFLDPMPSQAELMAFYPEETYYSYNLDFLHREPQWKAWLKKFTFMEWKTKDPKFASPGKMLDIGCGNGWFIYDMRSKGWQVQGVEPSKAGAEAGRKMANLEIHHGDLLSAAYPSESFDYIRSNHSFEHIPNPNEVLVEVHRIMKPGGKGLIGVPNINSSTGKMFKAFWYYLGAPVHTFSYSDTNLPQLLHKHGFKNIKVNYNSHYSGLLGSLQIFLNRKSGRTSFDGFLINFLPLKVLSGLVMKITDLARTGDCIEVIFEK
jgi:SAM-dependent methyltransferase